MANQKLILTASNIKYLLVLYELSPNNSGAKGVRLAEILGVTKPSVHTMIDTLKKFGLVRKDFYGEIFFTDEGICLAKKYNKYYKALCGYLQDCLSSKSDIRSAACALMAEVPQTSLAEMCSKITKIKKHERALLNAAPCEQQA